MTPCISLCEPSRLQIFLSSVMARVFISRTLLTLLLCAVAALGATDQTFPIWDGQPNAKEYGSGVLGRAFATEVCEEGKLSLLQHAAAAKRKLPGEKASQARVASQAQQIAPRLVAPTVNVSQRTNSSSTGLPHSSGEYLLSMRRTDVSSAGAGAGEGARAGAGASSGAGQGAGIGTGADTLRQDVDLRPSAIPTLKGNPRVAVDKYKDQEVRDDLFGRLNQHGGFFHSETVFGWLFLVAAMFGAVIIDLCIFRKLPEEPHWHFLITLTWVSIAAVFNLIVYLRRGRTLAISWALGYVLEWILSLDNLFVFTLIFKVYKTPDDQVHKALFMGILGALLMRAIFFIIVACLMDIAVWVHWPFGFLLIYSGIEAACGGDDDEDVENTRLMRLLHWCLGSRITQGYDEGGALVVWEKETGRLKVTYLFVVVGCLELTDLVFAMDSTTAKLAQIPDQYIAFSSTVFAMFGLRAVFFLLQDLVDMFNFLKYGICVVLVFIGLQLMLRNYVDVPVSAVLCVIASVFTICILGSIYHQRKAARMNPAA